MAKRIKITEHQLKLITKVINETASNVRLKNSIFKFLNADYIPSKGVKRLANEFYDTALIEKKIDGEMITPKALCDYITTKFSGLNKKEIIDSISGWYYGDYDEETGMRKKK